MFPSLATMSYGKFDQEFVARVFEDHQTFRVTFYVVQQCFLVWPGLKNDVLGRIVVISYHSSMHRPSYVV